MNFPSQQVEKSVASLNSNPAIPRDKNDRLTVIGMGRMEEDGNVSSTLLSTEIYLIDKEDCQKLYPEFLVNDEVVICAAGEGRDRYVQITASMEKKNNTIVQHLIQIFLTLKYGSCDGDSAAPLLSENDTMIGLVSWVSSLWQFNFLTMMGGICDGNCLFGNYFFSFLKAYSDLHFVCQGLGCARETRPGVYSRISAGYDWIRESMCALSRQQPAFCQPLDVPDGWIEKVRVDVEYDSQSELGTWTLYDEDHNPIINSTEVSVVEEGGLVSTYADIFEFGKYEIDVTNIQGKRRDSGRKYLFFLMIQSSVENLICIYCIWYLWLVRQI